MTTVDEIRALIAGGETLTVEFKGDSAQSLGDRDLVEAATCLANSRGGVILIGVEDSGVVTGARPRHGSYTDVRRLEAVIANRSVPSCPVECEVIAIDGHDVIVVRIPPGRPVTATTSGVYQRRALNVHGRPQCVPFLPHEIQSREGSRGAQDYSALAVPDATWSDLDPLEFERLRQTIARNPGRADASLVGLSDVELVKVLGLGEGNDGIERIRIAGLLMLGRITAIERLVPTHEAAFQVLSGTRVLVNDFLRLPLIRLSEELTSRFDARNEEEEILIGGVRAGIPAYSRPGYREAVHNALVHRDYALRGAVHVFWRDEELEITNPGGFPDDVNLGNLLVVAPRPRNPVLADAFKRIGLVERTGRGIDTIYEGQLRYGRSAPDYSRSSAGTVQVVLPGGPANLALARFIIEQDRPERPISVDEMLLVNAVDRERRIGVGRAAALMQKGEPAARALLERLVEAGVLEGRGEGKQRIYRFSATTYRAIGPASAYTRASGFEPLQQEQMVLSHLRAHGRITRSEVMDLCQVTSLNAKNLLRRLIRRGEIASRGIGRGTYYTIWTKNTDIAGRK
jgi:ATP-dependent DNA helicase RecG